MQSTNAMQEMLQPTASAEMADRKLLLSRVLPSMKLSNGSPSSMTPPPTSNTTTPAKRAADRFVIQGNAVVTGGCGGLGLEAARSLLDHGCSGVALLDINPLAAKADTDRLATEFPKAQVITKQVDVTDAGKVSVVFDEVCKEMGTFETLLCFAGVSSVDISVEVPAERFRKTLDINTTGSFVCAQQAAKHMIKHKSSGSILFVASVSGHRVLFPQPLAAYAASKAAIIHVARSLAAEWAVHGIRVNSISPGYMNTVLTQGSGLAQERKIWTERIPMGRIGEASELMGAVVLLSSHAGSYITGSDLVIDGGIAVF